MFGPAGIGWGFAIVDEKLLDGALLAPGFYERIHMARVRVWYTYEDRRGEVEHVGQTAFCGLRKDGKTYTDEDAPKKSVTDALVKALSMIGFAGDIFLGRWDDSRYVAELREEERQAKIAAAVPGLDRVASGPKAVPSSGDVFDRLRTLGSEAADRGMAALTVFWDGRTETEQAAIKAHLKGWVARAKSIDNSSLADPALQGAAA